MGIGEHSDPVSRASGRKPASREREEVMGTKQTFAASSPCSRTGRRPSRQAAEVHDKPAASVKPNSSPSTAGSQGRPHAGSRCAASRPAVSARHSSNVHATVELEPGAPESEVSIRYGSIWRSDHPVVLGWPQFFCELGAGPVTTARATNPPAGCLPHLVDTVGVVERV